MEVRLQASRVASAKAHVLKAALAARRESKKVDFKRSFDPESAAEWCELVKDLVAMANSGGGIILIGVNDDGSVVTDGSVAKVLSMDPAVVTDKIAKYTGVQFDAFAFATSQRDGYEIAVLAVGASTATMVFERPGIYELPQGRQRTAFSQGTVYVRHGAKSSPATTNDLSRIVERRVQEVRKEWMSGVRKVVTAPTGSRVSVLPASVRTSTSPDATPIRITDDLAAPEYRLVDPDVTHPWRQKELIAKLNATLPASRRLNQYHLRAIRHVYKIDSQPAFFYRSRHTSPRYSPAFFEWLVGQYNEDADFFIKAVEAMSLSSHIDLDGAV